MNILIGSALGWGTGGVNSYVSTLKTGLHRFGVNSYLVYPQSINTKQKIMAGIKAFGNFDKGKRELTKFQVIDTKLKSKNIIKGLKKTNDVIIHSQDVLHVEAVKDFNIPIILTVHGPLSREVEMSGRLGKHFKLYLKERERAAYERADHIIAVDTGQKEIIINEYNINPNKITVLLNAVDTNIFTPKTQEHSYPSFFLVPRRLVPKNGVSVAIKAFKQLLDLNVELWIAGDGPEKSMLQELIELERVTDKVRFLGEIDQLSMVNYMNLATGILIPSVPVNGVIEASSISALEGMSLSKPVIASNIGGLVEIIKDKSTGYLFNTGEPKDLALKIREVVIDSETSTKIGKNARKYILENHSSEIWLNKVLEIYLNTKSNHN